MVVFTCNNCGDSLQKPKVDKHYQTVCRSGKNLTCVDCLKDFRGEEYVSHIKCMTEDERYAAKGSMPNGMVKKGEVKQESWTDMIRSIIEKEPNLDVGLRNMMNIMSNYVNVPRKKAKFFNFILNSFGKNFNKADIEQVWDLIEKHKNAQFQQKKAENQENGTKEVAETKNSTNGTNVNGTSKEGNKRKHEANNNNDCETPNTDEIPTKKKKKSKKSSENDENNQENQTNGTNANGKCPEETIEKFSYENKILEVLNSKKQISLTKLQKKVLNAYIKHYGIDEHTEKQVKKFNQKLKKLANVKINDDFVSLT